MISTRALTPLAAGLLLASAAAASAQTAVQDRYGPPPAAAAYQAPAPRPASGVQPGYEPVLRAPLAPAADPAPDLLGGPPSGPLPTSIYGQAAAAPQAPAAPRTYAQAPATPRAGGSQLYSLHREYGMTPDAIPAPPAGDNFILVGPPDSPEAPGDEDEPAQGLDRQF